jgi:hypothetical protein
MSRKEDAAKIPRFVLLQQLIIAQLQNKLTSPQLIGLPGRQMVLGNQTDQRSLAITGGSDKLTNFRKL